jgi:tRNA(Ile)-lysidine synthase
LLAALAEILGTKSQWRQAGPAARHAKLRSLQSSQAKRPSWSGNLRSVQSAHAKPRQAQPSLRAIHINHGLHPNSLEWARHCRSLAADLSVPLKIMNAKVSRARGTSLEAAARDARYALLAAELAAGEFLLTAHHEDDQLETVLLQLFRGAGLAGLAAMPEMARWNAGWLVRPLLSRSRQELQDWVSGQGLKWIEDDTNADEQLDRNYLRRRVLPLIRQRWRGVGSAVARSARHAAEGQKLLDKLARADVDRVSNGASLSVQGLRALQPDRRRNALRFWIARTGAKVPDTRRLDELAGPVIDARQDSNPLVTWGDVVVRRHLDLLSMARDPAPHKPAIRESAIAAAASAATGPANAATAAGTEVLEWAWAASPTLNLPSGRGTLELKRDPRGPLDLGALPETVTVRSRSGGERLRPTRGGPRRALKSLLQEARLPLADRAQLPLIYAGDRLLAAGGSWLDESVQSGPQTVRRGRISWRR